MRWLRFLHRYLGLSAAFFLLLLAVTGGVLIFKEEIWRLQYPSLDQPLQNLTAADHAAAFRAIDAAFAGRVTLVRTPQPGVPAYHVYLRDGEALVHQSTHEVIDRWAWYDSPIAILTEVHMKLAAGGPGKIAVGWLGLAAGFMAISGLWLWWPVRRQCRMGSLWPKQLSRLVLLRLHRDLGAVAATFILLFALTGAAVIFNDTSRLVFNAILGDQSTSEPPPRRETPKPVEMPDHNSIELAQSELSHARLMSYSPPEPGNGVHYFRFRQPDEVHPNGRSTVYLDALNGNVLRSVDATQVPVGDRLANWMYPLHAARIGGWPYNLLALATALALAVMSVSGAMSFVQGSRSRRK